MWRWWTRALSLAGAIVGKWLFVTLTFNGADFFKRSISVWTTGKKKPVFNQPVAHGLHEVHSETEGVVATPRWIMSLACVRYGDVIASGKKSFITIIIYYLAHEA